MSVAFSKVKTETAYSGLQNATKHTQNIKYIVYKSFHKLPTAFQYTNEWTANRLKAIRAASQPVHPHSRPFTPHSRSTRSLVCHSGAYQVPSCGSLWASVLQCNLTVILQFL
jgi:hypothetical protein